MDYCKLGGVPREIIDMRQEAFPDIFPNGISKIDIFSEN